MSTESRDNLADILADFTGLHGRVARKSNVSRSMVSKVAAGHRTSPDIERALLQEFRMLNERLGDWLLQRRRIKQV